jgi:FG-GAP-like repeat/FG-GAP repeat
LSGSVKFSGGFTNDGVIHGRITQSGGVTTASALAPSDFNEDGLSDILWQNANGQAAIWEMSKNVLAGGGPLSPNPEPNWREVASGDFNGDGHADILWQNADGQASVWDMDGASLIGGGAVTPNPGLSWHAIGTGDFNHDGFSDILLQNSNTGAITIWEMNGTGLIGGGQVANPRLSWHAIGTGGRRLRHPAAKHERPGHDLGHERNHHHRRRPRQPQSGVDLPGRRADLKPHLRISGRGRSGQSSPKS